VGDFGLEDGERVGVDFNVSFVMGWGSDLMNEFRALRREGHLGDRVWRDHSYYISWLMIHYSQQ
jgi:hypothetical protein